MLSSWLYCLLLTGIADEKYLTWQPRAVEAAAAPASAGQPLTVAEVDALKHGSPTLPYQDVTSAVRASDGTLWVGTTRGLLRLEQGSPRWRVMHSRLWLPDDHVESLRLARDGSPIVGTKKGTVVLQATQTTLAEKMAAIEAQLRQSHLREGLVGDINLHEPGTFEKGHFQPSSDNDGLWTSIYVAAEAFRYGATRDPEAKHNARQSLEALMFLHDVTGIPGFVARSTVPLADDPMKYGGEWHRAADGQHWWKGDTSSDELDGHYFAYAIYHDLVADDAERAEIRRYVASITDHILRNDYYYVGATGKPTTWGVWHPQKINHDLKWYVDRGLNSLEMLSHLKVAEQIVGDPKYAAAAKDLIETHAYATNAIDQKILWPASEVNHSDDELAFLAYYPLVWYERDPHLRRVYLLSIERSWQIERPEQSPLFNFIYAAAQQANQWTEPTRRPDQALVPPDKYDREACVAWFRDVPRDTINWSIKNSDRLDLAGVVRNRFGRADSATVLPPSERRHMRWNGDPYELDGGADGRARDDGAYILLPYWMGRYHRFLE